MLFSQKYKYVSLDKNEKGMREINQSSPEATSHENRPASGNVCSQNRMYPKLIYFIQTYFLSKCKTEIKKSFHFSRFTQSLFKWVLAEGDSCNGAFFHFSFQQHQRKYWPQSSLGLPLGLFQQGKEDTSPGVSNWQACSSHNQIVVWICFSIC